MKKVAIVQSNYIPWKGYFDLIALADEFILYDCVQFTRRDWRNRNLIKTPSGSQWLTVPVLSKGNYFNPIESILIDGRDWVDVHLKAFRQNYSKSKFYYDILKILLPIYTDSSLVKLSDLNYYLIKSICDYLSIKTIISKSSDYDIIEGKSERLLSLCQQSNSSVYISGPSAKEYLDVNLFKDFGIEVSWFDYSGYKFYPQMWGQFIHEVSILDLLFNCGLESSKYMKFDLNKNKK